MRNINNGTGEIGAKVPSLELELSRMVEISPHKSDVKSRLDLGKSKYLGSDMNNNLSEALSNKSSQYIINNESKKDLEQRDVSLESITTNNGTILNSYLSSCPSVQTNPTDVVPDDMKKTMKDEPNESLLDTLMQTGAYDDLLDQNCSGLAPAVSSPFSIRSSSSSSVPVVDAKEKQLIDHSSNSNKTDEEKLTSGPPPLPDEQKLLAAIFPNCNDCSESSQSQVSSIEVNGVGSKQEEQSFTDNLRDPAPIAADDQNDENAISLKHSKDESMKEEKESETEMLGEKMHAVKADYNIECQEFPGSESVPQVSIQTNKTETHYNNENMQTNSSGEDVRVVHETVGDIPTDEDNTEQFHNTAENHSDIKISASSAEIKRRSANVHEDVESSEQSKTKEDEDGVTEKFAPEVVEEVDDKDGGIIDDNKVTVDESVADTENITSLEVEWLQQTLSIPFYKGVMTDQSIMTQSCGGKFARSVVDSSQTSLPIDFGESLPPRLTGLVNKQFRMLRLVKEPGMELGVLITKKFNKDKRTTGYIIAYIEPHGLVYRCIAYVLNTPYNTWALGVLIIRSSVYEGNIINHFTVLLALTRPL